MAVVKLALLSDLHANLHALQACLVHARGQGADAWAILGDLVGYGAHPGEVVDQVMALADAGAIVLRGNHDDASVRPPGERASAQDVSAAWTHTQLSAAQQAFLASLPLVAQRGGACLAHASVEAPAAWTYVDHPVLAERCLAAAEALAPGTRHVFCGHVHHQRLFYRGSGRGLVAFEPTPGVAVPVPRHRSWVATVGSVGQPRDGDPRAMYALFDVERERLAFHRVAYDHAGAAAAVRRAGLPAAFSERLEQGR